jgi:hypothetical protein
MFMKRKYTADIDTQDPFWMLLSDNQDDFLANDNVIFVCSTLKMTSFLVTWFGFIQLYSSIKDFTIDFPLNILVAILWWILIWQGTRFEIMFSRIKRIGILTLFAIELTILGVQIYTSVTNYYD